MPKRKAVSDLRAPQPPRKDFSGPNHAHQLGRLRDSEVPRERAGPLFMTTTTATAIESAPSRLSGLDLRHPSLGTITLAGVFKQGADTELYLTDRPGVVVKVFDLTCDKADEISYGPFVSYKLEIAHFEDVTKTEELRPLVPIFYGADVDYQRKFAYVAMEFLPGQDLKSWSEEIRAAAPDEASTTAFRHAGYEAISVIDVFHRHGLVLVDFKPENAIRHPNGRIRFVDLGAFFTARYRHGTKDYLYSATPDHAEVLIDACNLETGHPVTEASDIFSAGVAFFEMATGISRLQIEPRTADEILERKELYLFRDTQIRDVWKQYPHLKHLLPTVETQLLERQLLFADFWHILRAYVGEKVPEWDSLPEAQHTQVLLETGATFIRDQLPAHLDWLADPIAYATTLRGLRLQRVSELRQQLADPIGTPIAVALLEKNSFVRALQPHLQPAPLLHELNSWDVRQDPASNLWTLSAPTACALAPEAAGFTFLKQIPCTASDERLYEVSEDLEADDFDGGKLSVAQLQSDRHSWLI